MARRSGGGSRGFSSRPRMQSPARPAPSRPTVTQPAVAPQQPTSVASPVGGGGGMFQQVASTAAGVAIGHTVGHAITGALGMNGGGHSDAVAPAAQPSQSSFEQQPQGLNQQDNPCKFEMDQFLACANNNSHDLSLCTGFNEVMKECKTRYSHMYM